MEIDPAGKGCGSPYENYAASLGDDVEDFALTASHFATDFYPVQPGDIAFVDAAAGGLGLLLTQISNSAAAESLVVSRLKTRWPRPKTPGPIDIMNLPKRIKIGYSVFSDQFHSPELLRMNAARLFAWIADGRLKVQVGQEYPLADAAQAHADLESRKTTGKLLLVP